MEGSNVRLEFEKIKAHLGSLESRKIHLKREIEKKEQEVEDLAKVSTFFRNLIDKEILESVKIFEQIQTDALRTIFFDQNLSVESDVKIERGKVSVSFNILDEKEDGTLVKSSSLDQFGGAIYSVQSFILRVLLCKKHGLKSFFVLDETFPAFDSVYAQRMVEFIKSLCDKMDLHILLVTHNTNFFDLVDKKYRIRKDRKSRIKFISESNENQRSSEAKT